MDGCEIQKSQHRSETLVSGDCAVHANEYWFFHGFQVVRNGFCPSTSAPDLLVLEKQWKRLPLQGLGETPQTAASQDAQDAIASTWFVHVGEVRAFLECLVGTGGGAGLWVMEEPLKLVEQRIL